MPGPFSSYLEEFGYNIVGVGRQDEIQEEKKRPHSFLSPLKKQQGGKERVE